ncbi:hypothetical protein U7859_02305 [Bradyrhizobium ottawaense]|uniref:COG3904 family protein n=1 Tax=Bradyrhizobium ottawaense TaxID=931866 RepID=UPI002ADFCD90|nr:hypothetical protein [Bradyrhizobium ottawaense]WQN83336.1 hypothetical protein U7859_02305 [Bradyrhizobium ottawaense]
MNTFARIAGALLCLCLSEHALSAEFRKSSLGPSAPDLIEVAGELIQGDEAKFIETAIKSADAIVVFHSAGGNLLAGIEIGKAIRLKGFSTLVPDNMHCASACALAWLAGRVRLMSDTARVGFHAVYTSEDGETRVSSAGNAIAGAYLNQLGIPMSAIIYITGAPPDSMQWLNFADAQRVGIEVKRLNLTEDAKASQPPVQSTSSVDLLAAIAEETRNILGATNKPNDVAIAYLQQKYSEQVSYYGKSLSKASVVSDKLTFFQRWPVRNYSLVADSLRVTCDTQSTCASEGKVEWSATNPKATSQGSAAFSYGWSFEAGVWKVRSERSKVISRSVSPNGTEASGSSHLPQYHLDQSGGRVASLTNLYQGTDCHASGQTVGKVARRSFSNDGVALTGFVIEGSDGNREFVNTSVEFGALDAATAAWIRQGMNTLIREGRTAAISTKACGAAGRVLMLDSVR